MRELGERECLARRPRDRTRRLLARELDRDLALEPQITPIAPWPRTRSIRYWSSITVPRSTGSAGAAASFSNAEARDPRSFDSSVPATPGIYLSKHELDLITRTDGQNSLSQPIRCASTGA
jgi:hypothetical protein